MKTIKSIGFLALFATFSACNQTPYTAEIETVNKLLAKMDSAEQIHARIDTTGLTEGKRVFNQKFNFVTANYTKTPDTLHRQEAMLISDYRNLKKPYDRFSTQYAANAKELEFSKKQLLDLRHDLEHNLLDTNFVTRMVASETEAAERLMAETKRIEDIRTTMIESQSKLEPKIDSLITLIQENL